MTAVAEIMGVPAAVAGSEVAATSRVPAAVVGAPVAIGAASAGAPLEGAVQPFAAGVYKLKWKPVNLDKSFAISGGLRNRTFAIDARAMDPLKPDDYFVKVWKI